MVAIRNKKKTSLNRKSRLVLILIYAFAACTFYLTRNLFRPSIELNFPPANEIINPSLHDKTAELPQWVKSYIQFHNEARKQYPGTEILTNPNAPKLLIRLCLGLCGGLHDRLGQIPLDLVIANETNRVLLIQWHKPHPLENYLLPNDIDWRVPEHVGYDDINEARDHLFLPFDNGSDIKDLDDTIQQMKTGDLSHEKCLNTRLLADQRELLLSSRLKLAGETDMIDNTQTFSLIFKAFFKIHPNIQKLIDEIKQNLNLETGKYSAVHCRVRHPKGWPKGKPPPRAEVERFPADRSDLIFDGFEKEHTVAVASHAIRCAKNLTDSDHPHEPIYLLTDTFKLTNFMLGPESPFHGDKVNLIARNDSIPSIHIDRKKGRPIEEHYGTFIDLFMTVDARCVSYGIGNFGRFATKLSGTTCKNQHREVEWDTHDAPRWFAPACKLGDGVDEN